MTIINGIEIDDITYNENIIKKSILNNLPIEEFLHVIVVISNPCNYAIRYILTREFIRRMKDEAHILLYVVELAYGDSQDFHVTDPSNKRHLQLRCPNQQPIWHKENLINIGISRLPPNWKYVAWIDGDIDFVRPDWIVETIHELQHHPVVQLFEDAIDLGPNHEILTTHKSFASCYKKNMPYKSGKDGETLGYYYGKSKNGPGTYWHPGYAWAATRDAINTT
jgi:hypothetical protein